MKRKCTNVACGGYNHEVETDMTECLFCKKPLKTGADILADTLKSMGVDRNKDATSLFGGLF